MGRLLLFPLAILALVHVALLPGSNTVLAATRGPDAHWLSLTVSGGSQTIYLPFIVGFQPVQKPILKWAFGGCFSSWCETGWYSSPVVLDINRDGKPEVVGADYSIVALEGATGSLIWRQAAQGGREWPGVVAADIDGDGVPEIVTAHSGGYLNIFNLDGSIRRSILVPPGKELRSLAVSDLDRDGKMEILVASTASDDQWTVYEPDGNRRPGWPQLGASGPGYAAGAYNENIAAADLDGDGRGEIIAPSDVHYITAYQDDGLQIWANKMYGLHGDGSQKFWSEVGVHVDQTVDLRGYAECGIEHRPNFADSAPVIGDLDGNGSLEIVVVGNIYNCGTSPYTDLYQMPFIFNPDRSRWSAAAFDWTVLPKPDAKAAPRSEDYNVIENDLPNPALVDLDGDGKKEIVFPSYDGRMHAFWLDKTEHGHWPFQVAGPNPGDLQFASEPAVADLNGDGQAEVVFTSWTLKGSNRSGSLYILDSQGSLLYQVPLPAAKSDDWNGGLAAPTLANLDNDPDLELVVNTSGSGMVAYDLPGTAHARILWGTGRGGYLRNGRVP